MTVHIFRCGFMHQYIGIKHSQQRSFLLCLFLFLLFFVSFCKSAARSLLLIHWSCAKLGDQGI